MFWESIAAVEENSLQLLLKSGSTESLDLELVLTDPFVLQELRSGNKTLIDFLSRKDNLLEMLKISIQPDNVEEAPLALQYKKSHICSEILTVRNNDDLINALVMCDGALEFLLKSLDDVKKMNHLVASFFMKIVMHLLHRHFSTTMEIFESTKFVTKCLGVLRFGAMGELLQNILKIPSSNEEINQLKEHLLNMQPASSLVALFDPSQSPAVHENCADLYIDIVRNLRDLLYSFDEKEDTLHESMFTEKVVTDLTKRMLEGDVGSSSSILMNCSEVLGVLIETNTIMFCPSHLIESEKLGESWAGGNPGDPLHDHSEQVWHADQDRIVERIVSSKTAEIVTVLIADLESGTPTGKWLYLMRLLVLLCDTNKLSTHNALVEGMRKADFKRIFALVYRHPLCSIFHKLLHKIVSYALYSNLSEGISPMVSFFFEDCQLVDVLSGGVSPVCVLPKMTLISLRSFHTYLGLSVLQALENSPSKLLLDGVLKSCSEWETVKGKLAVFLEWNHTDADNSQQSARSSNGSTLGDPQLDFYEEDRLKTKQLHEYESNKPTKLLPDIFDQRDTLDGSSATERFRVPCSGLAAPLEVNLDDNDLNEKDFEALCQLKCTETDDWPVFPVTKLSNSPDAWPRGADPSGGGSLSPDWPTSTSTDDSPFTVNWDSPPPAAAAHNTSNGVISDDWPASGPSTSSPFDGKPGEPADGNTSGGSIPNEGKDDSWADFTSAKSPFPSQTGAVEPETEQWPSVPVVATESSGTQPSNDWPSSEMCLPASDPVMLGFASGLLTAATTSPTPVSPNESDC